MFTGGEDYRRGGGKHDGYGADLLERDRDVRGSRPGVEKCGNGSSFVIDRRVRGSENDGVDDREVIG